MITITALTSTSVTFTPGLNHTHFGSPSQITNSYGTLDTRAAVGHINRNIQIVAGANVGWGFRVLVYGYIDPNNITRTGVTSLSGVEFLNGGQANTEYAALHFLNDPNNVTSTVTGCSFVTSQGYSLNLVSSANVTITNNVFFQAQKFIVAVTSMQDYTFTNNLLIDAQVQADMAGADAVNVACYFQYQPINWATDNNVVQNNLCQGSDLNGFILPFVPCQYLGQEAVGFQNNTAGTCTIGFLVNVVPGACLGFEYVKAYSNSIGWLASPQGPMNIQYNGFMLADNGRGMNLRHGFGSFNGDNNTLIIQNSWITAISRPNCSYCYGPSATDCTGNYAMRMMVTTPNGESLPDKFNSGFDVICQPEAYDTKAFLVNVNFDSYRQDYTNNANLSQCSNNVVFIPHPLAHDHTGSHHLTQSPCTNCQSSAYGDFTPEDPSVLGWLGGCGLILCTGKTNYVIQDHDGSFLGYPGTILANNSVLGENEPNCTYNADINGYICNRTDFAVLEYESIAPDFNTRIMWPVNLSYWGGTWTSVTNGYR
jgi:hypothetical protein